MTAALRRRSSRRVMSPPEPSTHRLPARASAARGGVTDRGRWRGLGMSDDPELPDAWTDGPAEIWQPAGEWAQRGEPREIREAIRAADAGGWPGRAPRRRR